MMSSVGPSPSKRMRLGEDPFVAGGPGSDDDDDGFDEATTRVLKDLGDFQKKLDELNKMMGTEIHQVEAKYNKLRKPYYNERAAMINEVPNFWSIALSNHPQISQLLYEDEIDCLHFLKELLVDEFENEVNEFRIRFVFDENPFFENPELVKELKLGPGGDPTSSSTPIRWKEQMDLTKTQLQIIDERRKSGMIETAETFFSWFSNNKACCEPLGDDIANLIRNEVWTNPLDYFFLKNNMDQPSLSENEEQESEEEECEEEECEEEECEEEECEDESEEEAYEKESEVKESEEMELQEEKCKDDEGGASEKEGQKDEEQTQFTD